MIKIGVLIKWSIPTDPDVTYDTTQIHRATSQNGIYTQVASQSISDNIYFDTTGTSTNWYKIKFYDSSSGQASDFSDALQGGDFSLFCTIDDIRTISGLNSNDVSDTVLFDILRLQVIPQINKEIGVKIIREPVEYIDQTRQNKTDGSNATYYVKKWRNYYLGDLDNDGDVDTGDVVVTLLHSNDTEEEASVSSVTEDAGKIVLSTAPASSDEVFLTYIASPVSISDPDRNIRMAAANLAAAYAHLRINAKKLGSFSIGKMRIGKQSEGFKLFMEEYQRMINKIKNKPLRRVEHTSVLDDVIAGV